MMDRFDEEIKKLTDEIGQIELKLEEEKRRRPGSDALLISIIWVIGAVVCITFKLGAHVFLGIIAVTTAGALTLAGIQSKGDNSLYSIREKRKAIQQLAQLKLQRKSMEENEKKALGIFQQAMEHGLTRIVTEEQKQGLHLIAKSFGVEDVQQALQLFSQGRELATRRMLARTRDEQDEQCRLETLHFAQETELAALGARSKYAAVLSQKGMEHKVIDDENSERYFGMLDIQVKSCEVTAGGNIKVTLDIHEKQPVTLLGREAIVDGVLTVVVSDDKGNFATGHCCGDGYELDDLRKAGFRGEYTTICCSPKGRHFEPDAVLECKVKAGNLWAAEI